MKRFPRRVPTLFVLFSLVLVVSLMNIFWRETSTPITHIKDHLLQHNLSEAHKRGETRQYFVNVTERNALFLQEIDRLKLQTKAMRHAGVVIPWNKTALTLTRKLQRVTYCYLLSKFNERDDEAVPHIIEMVLQFPPGMVTRDALLKQSSNGTGIRAMYIALAPLNILPHAVFTVRVLLIILIHCEGYDKYGIVHSDY